MSTRPTIQSNRRDFVKYSCAGLLAAGLEGTLKAEGALSYGGLQRARQRFPRHSLLLRSVWTSP